MPWLSFFGGDMATFQEMADFWKNARVVAEQGAIAAAEAGAQYIQKRIQQDTLMRSQHPPGAWHETRDGDPPAMASGKLARDTYSRPAFGDWARASAAVGNSSDYARITEYGCTIEPVSVEYMHWKDSGAPVTGWYHRFLENKGHPFISTTVDESVDDGSLHDVMVEAFREYDP